MPGDSSRHAGGFSIPCRGILETAVPFLRTAVSFVRTTVLFVQTAVPSEDSSRAKISIPPHPCKNPAASVQKFPRSRAKNHALPCKSPRAALQGFPACAAGIRRRGREIPANSLYLRPQGANHPPLRTLPCTPTRKTSSCWPPCSRRTACAKPCYAPAAATSPS